jgi:hypothetical protein
MKTFLLSFPRLNISITAPDEFVPDIEAAFIHSIRSESSLRPLHQYIIQPTSNGLGLLKDGSSAGKYGSSLEMLCHMEEDIEITLTQAIGNWVGFHAGAVKVDGFSCLIVGNPDTGKTTTTFNLIEMGKTFLCEEVSPIDPGTLLVHPYPQVLTMSRSYAEEYLSLYPIREGELRLFDSDIARYHPFRAGDGPVPLKAILVPAYNPSGASGIEELSPGEVFTELLRYCFPPNRDEEHLFDSVIKICEESEIFRLRTNSLQSTRGLLKELFELD